VGNRINVEYMAQRISTEALANRINDQLRTLVENDPDADPALILVIAFRESGINVLSTRPTPIETFGRGGLDHLGSNLERYRDLGYLPEGYGERWREAPRRRNPETATPANPKGDWVYPAIIPRNELIVAYGMVIRDSREIFESTARAIGFDLDRLTQRARRAWNQIAFG
jgi:hypothetical protein